MKDSFFGRHDAKDAAQIQANLGLCADWMNRLARWLSQEDGDCVSGETLACRIAAFELEAGLAPTGIVTRETRLALLDKCPSLRIRLIGPNIGSGAFFSWQTEQVLYDYFREGIERLGGIWTCREGAVQLVGLRGAHCNGQTLIRTDGVRQFSNLPYGERLHFSSAKPDYFDSLMGMFWTESREKHARIFRCVVNPASVWDAGTAHLNNGQYAYCVGKHRTRDVAHIDAVRHYAGLSWQKSWITDDTGDSVQYLALVGCAPVEVIRSSGNSLDISPDDIDRAEKAIAARIPEYVDAQKIRINIHSCAQDRASSLGCQNIAPEDYAEFMSAILRCCEMQKKAFGFALPIAYYLTDSSWFE